MYKKANPTPKKKKAVTKKKTAAKKPVSAAVKRKTIKSQRASEVDKILSTIGSPSKKSKLSAAQRAKKKRVISSYVNANKRR